MEFSPGIFVCVSYNSLFGISIEAYRISSSQLSNVLLRPSNLTVTFSMESHCNTYAGLLLFKENVFCEQSVLRAKFGVCVCVCLGLELISITVIYLPLSHSIPYIVTFVSLLIGMFLLFFYSSFCSSHLPPIFPSFLLSLPSFPLFLPPSYIVCLFFILYYSLRSLLLYISSATIPLLFNE